MHHSESTVPITAFLQTFFLAVGFIVFIVLSIAVARTVFTSYSTSAPVRDLQPELALERR